MAKKIFKDEINEKTLILVSIYFLQPMLTFWGLTRAPINFNIIYAPFLYFIIISIVLIILIFFSKYLFTNEKDKSIFIVASLIGNTGNLGIPLGIALFGESSVPYTSIINIANIFFIYTVGIYFYAKSSFSVRDSIISMLKIPILWFAIFALIYNYFGFKIHPQINLVLEMGAYSTIVLQLIIFGVYLAKTKINSYNYRLSFSVNFVKLIFLPIVGLCIILLAGLSNEIATILMISLLTPLAVNNVNISALYNCNPYDVTSIVFTSTLLFLLLIYFDLEILKLIF
jgi:hypothetical protein